MSSFLQRDLHVLLVEDDADDALLIALQLEGSAGQYRHLRAERIAEAESLLRSETFGAAILDLTLPDSQGVESLQRLRQVAPELPVVVLTGHADEELAIQCLDEGAQDYLVKGSVDPELMHRCLRYAVKRKEAEDELQWQLRYQEAVSRLGLRAAGTAELGSLVEEAVREALCGLRAEAVLLLGRGNAAVAAFGGARRTTNAVPGLEGTPMLLELEQRFERLGNGGSGDLNLVFEKDLAGFSGIWAEVPLGKDRPVIFGAFSRGPRRLSDSERVFFQSVCNVLGLAFRRWDQEQQRKLQEGLFRRIAENLAEGVIITALDGQILYCNPQAERFVGRWSPGGEVTLPNRLREPEQRAAYVERIASLPTTSSEPLEVCFEPAPEKRIWAVLRVSAMPAGNGTINALVALTDLTERKTIERRLQQAERMESMGRLAGGIAHDFNNLLTVINGNAELALRRLAPETSAHAQIDQILSAGNDAANLVENLLTYSRKRQVDVQPLPVNAEIRRVEKLLDRLLGEAVELRLDLAAEDLMILADPGQLEQIFLNLAANASYAMSKGGTLGVKTRLETGGPSDVLSAPARGPWAVISFTDTGHGIAEETLPHVFEPFFTTKPVGKGTGLGLATVHGLVGTMKGTITVSSQVGEGACFEIRFPVCSDPSAVSDVEPTRNEELGKLGGTVLLVEDQAAVRALATDLLAAMGLDVIVTAGAREALEVASRKRSEIDLVLSDIVMPEVSGWQLALELREIAPELEVLLMTGYDDPPDEPSREDLEIEVLRKPLDLTKLHASLQRHLGNARRGPR